MNTPRRLAHGLNMDEWSAWCAGHDQPPYRAKQVWEWLYARRAASWDAMTNLPARFRAELEAELEIQAAVLVESHGQDDGTRKLLVDLRDGEQVEEVLIPADRRRTVCVSTQAGCRFNCAFCASGQAGFARQLEAAEIVAQVLLAAQAYEECPTHVVCMGIGEPLDNYDAVLRAVRTINHPDGLSIGARRITISTCGIIPGIERLAGEGIQVELSVSLHAARDDLRSALMPVNRRYPLADLLLAGDRYTQHTKRIITYEYTLIRGINDSADEARAVAQLLAGRACRVNLIPLSPVEEFEASPPLSGDGVRFAGILKRAGINTTVRASKGTRVDAGCGQLRYRKKEGDQEHG